MSNNIRARNAPTGGIASANIRFAADRCVPMESERTLPSRIQSFQ